MGDEPRSLSHHVRSVVFRLYIPYCADARAVHGASIAPFCDRLRNWIDCVVSFAILTRADHLARPV
jgi:hypothetical protein